MTETLAGEATAESEIEPFTIDVPEHDLADLRGRLDRVRLSEPETVPDASQGPSPIRSPTALRRATPSTEKFAAYADTRAEAGGGVSVSQQIDNIALYWLTGTGSSSSRWYWEAMRWVPRSAEQENAQPVTTPTACSLFRSDPWPTARRWAQRRYLDLRSWHELDRGGHFPGLEQPALLVSEIRDAFRHERP